MTVCVAAKGAGFTLMAADSLTELGGVKMTRIANSSKILRFENFAVSMCGTGPIRDVLERMHYEPLPVGEDDESTYDWREHVMDNTLECDKFLQRMCELFRDRDGEENLQTIELLFTTPEKIFHTVGDHTVFEVSDFWSIGSGSSFALGDLHRRYIPAMTQSELTALVREAAKTACFYSSGCQEPIDIEVLTE